MLTRHFYESDEVMGALQYTILQGRTIEMAFWMQELTDSNMAYDAFRTTVGTWLLYVGVHHPTWVNRALASWRGEAVSGQELGLNLIFCAERDITPFAVLAQQSDAVDRVTGSKPCTIETYFQRAVRQCRVRSAWWATREMGSGRAWDLLAEFHEGRYRDCIQMLRELANDEPIWLCGAVTFVSLLHGRRAREPTWYTVSKELDAQIGQWEALKGRRARRSVAIPVSSICGVGPRWSIPKSETNIRRLHDIESAICNDGAGFWWDTMKSAGFAGEWVSDDAKEAFYSTYFPDDIPDEWSLADQKKSHGTGMLRPDETMVSGSRWARCWLPTGAGVIGAWGTESAMLATFGRCIEYTEIERLPVWKCADMEQHLRPVRREFAVDL